MKKSLFAIALSLILLVLFALAGCTKNSTTPTPPSNSPPAAPTGLNISQQLRKEVDLGWAVGTDTVTVDSFVINRAPDSLTWALIASVNGTFRAYIDNTISANRKQYFRVKAANTFGSSDWVYASIYTLPGAWNFSTDQTLMFIDEDINGGGSYHTWTWNHADSTGKLSITAAADSQQYVRVVTDSVNRMPNTGWFESKIKVPQWYGFGDAASYATFFVEREYTNATDNVVGIFFSQDSSVFGYYSSGSGDSLLHRVMTNPELPLLGSNAWHTIRLFHQNSRWQLIIDGTLYFNDLIANVANGSYQLYEEWQFDRGVSNPLNQDFWIDDVANNAAVPTSILMPQGGARNMHSMRGVAHRK